MRPYYDQDGITIYCADCRDVLPTLLAGSVDLVLTDPPYGETSLAWDRLVRGWPALVRPLLRATGSLWVFGSLRSHLQTAGDFAGWRLAQDVIWEKHNGSGFAADRFRRVHEQAAHWYCAAKWGGVYKDPQFTADATARRVSRSLGPKHTGKVQPAGYLSVTNGPRLMRSVLQVRSCQGEAVNETQKPVAIVLPLLEYSCPPDGLVLDPFMGSGTTLVAAKQSGRRAIGIEAREDQCAEAVKRLQQAVLPLAAAQ